ncbi:MAG TPA: ATP-dependent RecD-like DNA helicase [Candidatus Atribacteria bacterium]|nr:ATP-dependent RecD-like DNA helicase [Candidatus Atribacteria bacterium]
METITGTIEKIVYRNEENGYVIAKVSLEKLIPGKTGNENEEKLATIVGNMASVNIGETYALEGEWVNNPKYGWQFNFNNYRLILPTSLLGLKRYLGSGLIKGVGPATADRIIEHFGNKTLEILENDLQKLTEVEGIAEKRIKVISKSWEEQKEIKRVMIFLQSYQITTGYAVKIYKTYGNSAIEKLKENPYRLVDDVFGIGFKIADRIAQNLGIESTSPARIKAGIKYILNELANQGHCYGIIQEIIKQGSELLEVEEILVEKALVVLKNNKEVIVEEDRIWLPLYYFAELGVSKKLIELLKFPQQIINLDVPKMIKHLEKRYNISFAEEQKEAIKKVLLNRVLVLTGGPGTGKTTTTLGLIELFKELKLKIVLAAPTGRAAKRMSETTGREAKTIHRLLEYSPKSGTFTKNSDNPLRAEVIILDEVSMIDILLMNNLLKAVIPGTFLILIGDVDQLPSVGPGNLLRDIIDSETIPVVRLTKIFRQDRRSLIIVNAHRVNEGKYPIVKGERERDFYFIEEEDPGVAAQKIINLCTVRLPSKYKIDPVDDIQILSPMYKGEVGADNLNYRLREALNLKGKQIKYGNHSFKVNDKVMQIKNNYDKDVFNGDIGRINHIDVEENILEVNFYGRKVNYDFSELNELVLAYAITVHKSQGSEYRIVIIPVMTQHYLLLQRNLLYTGITRAKDMVILIGTKKALWIAIKNNKTFHRNTSLKQRLREISEEK